MKYKVGDKVKVRSKEWWDAQPKNAYGNVKCGSEVFVEGMTYMCGKTVTISAIRSNTYRIGDEAFYWTDEMFEGLVEDSQKGISEKLIKDISEVIKKNNLSVSVSEKDGKLIIEPLVK